MRTKRCLRRCLRKPGFWTLGLCLIANPALGVCEDEFVWDGTAGNWSQESKWLLSGANNMGTPGAGDCALIGSGTVTLDLSVTLETLELTGGQLSGLFDLDVATFEWTGGTLGGADFTSEFLTTSAGCQISGASTKLVAGRTIICGGISDVVDGGDIIIGSLTTEAEIRVPSGSTMRLAGNQAFQGQGASVTGTFVNQGLFERPLTEVPGPSGTTVFTAMPLDNTGTVRVEEGSLELAGGVSTGAFLAEVPNQLVITFQSGTHQLLASFSFGGSGYVGQTGGTVDVDAAGSAVRWRQLGGTLQGDGNFTMEHFAWSGGTLQGPGDKIATTSLTLEGSANKTAAGSFVIENRGTGVWQGTGTVFLDQSTLRNTATGQFDIENDATLSRGAGQGFLDNLGILRKTSSAGTTSLQLSVTNAGTVDIESGDLELKAPGTGTYHQVAGSTSLPTGHSLTASNLVLDGGTVTIDGTLSGVAGPMNQITVNGGELRGDGSATANNVFTLGSGTLAGNLDVTGNLISGGIVSPGASPGAIELIGNATLSAGSTLFTELGGLDAGSTYDQLFVSGTASLGGTLEVRFVPGYVPSVGDGFVVLNAATTGNFAATDLPAGFVWQVETDPVVLILLEDNASLFLDGFEDGTTDAWTVTVPAP